jgi:protein-S-isoprenylcysteine O-methyltransferase Ste14
MSHDSISGAAEGPTLAARLARIPLVPRMVFYTLFFLGVLFGVLPTINYHLIDRMAGLHYDIGAWRWVGVVLFTVSTAVYLAIAFHLTNRGRGAFVEFDPPSQLVTTGPYRWVRNPISVCVLVMMLGQAIMLSSTAVTLMFLVGFAVAQAQAVLLEEPLLEKRFGKQYLDYKARVSRWIPRPPSDA